MAPISEMYTPYVVPSENGSRTNVAWIQFEREQPKVNAEMESLHITEKGVWTTSHRGAQANPDNPKANENTVESPTKALEAFFDSVVDDGADASRQSPRRDRSESTQALLTHPIVRISASVPLNFSAMPFTTDDLNSAMHSTELEAFPRPFTSVNVDPFLMGVGGDDSWSACVHEEFLLLPDKYSFDLDFSFLVDH